MRVIQVKLEPTASQTSLLNEMLGQHRHIYNSTLEYKKILYEEFDKTPLSGFNAIKEVLPVLKRENEINLVNYSSGQQTIRRLDKAFNHFFHGAKKGRKSGFPRFKNADRFNTIEYARYGDGGKIKNGKFYLQHVGLIKALWFEDIPNPKTFSITRRSNGFYVNFIIDDNRAARTVRTGRDVGIDFGLKTFVTTSDGEKIESPKYLKQSLKRIQKAHRKISRAEKGSVEREKAKRVLNKVSTKVSNQRKDFNHKLSRRFINEYDRIFIEDLDTKKMQEGAANEGKKAVSRTYSDVAWGQFKQFLTYKAENAGKVIGKVKPEYTSQECHRCQRITPKTLEERTHVCSCGCIEDRDINAAKNILRRGLASLYLV